MRIPSTAFDFDLPQGRIAQRPRPYEEQRLLVYERASRAIRHHLFSDLPGLLRPGDLLVVNDSKVVPAQLGEGDGPHILLMEPTAAGFNDLHAMCPSKPQVGDRLKLPGATFVVKAKEPSSALRVGDLIPDEPFESLIAFLEACGSPPLPPYVRREPDARDEQDYQTMFAATPGSIAAPTAGLHFHPALVSALQAQGVEMATVTLHVGYGTFRQFQSEYVDGHTMDSESYRVSAAAAGAIWRALRAGRRVIGVGTTATRTLETIAPQVRAATSPQELAGKATLFIYPPYHFQVVGGLVTNFHYPRTPVMSLTAACCGGIDELHRIYREALAHDYQFYSYGDAMLAI